MIILQCLLESKNTQDRKTVLDLMRRFSSNMRYAFQRLLELVPVPGIGTMALPKYRLSGSEVSEMAEYKYPDPSCSFIQFG
jgi:hypothetical protein